MIQRSMAVSWSTIGALPLTSRKNVEVAFGSGTVTLFQGIELVGGFNGGIWFLFTETLIFLNTFLYAFNSVYFKWKGSKKWISDPTGISKTIFSTEMLLRKQNLRKLIVGRKTSVSEV